MPGSDPHSTEGGGSKMEGVSRGSGAENVNEISDFVRKELKSLCCLVEH